MCVCMCVCMCARHNEARKVSEAIHAYIHTYVYDCSSCVYIPYVYMDTHTHIKHTHTNTHTDIHTYIPARVLLRAHTHNTFHSVVVVCVCMREWLQCTNAAKHFQEKEVCK